MQEEIFSKKNSSISQCEESDSFLLKFQSEEISFKLCDLYSFRKKILSINILELLDSSAPDSEIIHLHHCDRILVLNIFEILELRELLSGTFDILALNSTVQGILRKGAFSF